MIPRIKSTDILSLILLVLALAGIGYLAYDAAPAGHREYEQNLLAFINAENGMTADVYQLEIGAVDHFDTLAASVREVRRAEARLNRLPHYVSTAVAFNEARLQLAVMVNQKLALVEEFKTALAGLHLGVDSLRKLIEEAETAIPDAHGDTLAQLLRVAGGLAAYVQDPSETIEEKLTARIATLATMAGEGSDAALQAALSTFTRQAEGIIAQKKSLDTLLRGIASVPLAAQGTRLSDAYQAAYETSRRNTTYALSAAIALLVLSFAALALTTRWRAHQNTTTLMTQRDAIKEALKEARTQSVSLRRSEQDQDARLAEERYKALLQHAFDMIAILSRQENYIYASPASVALLGLTEKELIGKSVYEGIHSDDIIKVQDYLTRAQKELQTEQTVQYRLMDAFGKWHLVETFASNQASNPAVRGMVLNTRKLGPAPDGKSR